MQATTTLNISPISDQRFKHKQGQQKNHLTILKRLHQSGAFFTRNIRLTFLKEAEEPAPDGNLLFL